MSRSKIRTAAIILAVLLTGTAVVIIAMGSGPTGVVPHGVVRVNPAVRAAARDRTSAVVEAPAREILPPLSSMDPRDARDACLVTVRSTLRHPISAADVYVLTRSAVLSHTRTDTAGECYVALSGSKLSGSKLPGSKRPLRPLSILAVASGFGEQAHPIPRLRPKHVEITLASAARINGRVILEDGRPPPLPVRVWAWTSIDDPSPATFRIAAAGVPIIRSTISDSGGFFELEGVSPKATYSMGAGARGWASHEMLRNVHATSGPVEIKLWRLYGCVVRAVLANGGEPPPSHLASRTWGAPGDAVDVDYPSVQLSMGGVSAPRGVPRHGVDWRKAFVGYISPHETPGLGPLQITCKVPGFADALVAVFVPALGPEIPEVLFRMSSNGLGLGVVRIQFDGGPQVDGDWLTGVWLTPSVLYLRLESDASVAYRIPLDSLSGTVNVPGVPFGVYRAQLLTGNWNATWKTGGRRGVPLVVGRKPAVLRVSVADLGSVVLEPAEDAGAARSEKPRIVIHRHGKNPREVGFAFRRRPYVLQGLRPGTYDFEVFTVGRDGKESVTKVGPVEILAGHTTEQVFSWSK